MGHLNISVLLNKAVVALGPFTAAFAAAAGTSYPCFFPSNDPKTWCEKSDPILSPPKHPRDIHYSGGGVKFLTIRVYDTSDPRVEF